MRLTPVLPAGVIHTPGLVERHHDGYSGAGDGIASQGEDEVLVRLVAMNRYLLVGCNSAGRVASKREPESRFSPNAGVRWSCGDAAARAEDPIRRTRPRCCAESKRKTSDGPEGRYADGRLARWDIVELDDIACDHRLDNGRVGVITWGFHNGPMLRILLVLREVLLILGGSPGPHGVHI